MVELSNDEYMQLYSIALEVEHLIFMMLNYLV